MNKTEKETFVIKRLRDIDADDVERICHMDCPHCPLAYFPDCDSNAFACLVSVLGMMDDEIVVSGRRMKIESFPIDAFYKDVKGRILPITIEFKLGLETELGRFDRYYGKYQGADESMDVVVHENRYGIDWALSQEELK